MRRPNHVKAISFTKPLQDSRNKASSNKTAGYDSRSSQSLVTILLLLCLSFVPTASPATEDSTPGSPDITSFTLEELSATDVVNTTSFVQQAVDAPSAVSVVTAEEIRRFGYRTISEILDSMRGIHITYDKQYAYLGGRGYGAPSEYAGRIILLIDGYSAADNYYNQVYITDDGYLDTALIDRIEYAPGPGSAIYGNNAFLGVVNIITKKGRNIDGLEAELTGGSHKDREGRVSWGKRTNSGMEWLISLSERGRDDTYSTDPDFNDISSQRQFLKMNYHNWSLEVISSDKQSEYEEVGFFGDLAKIEIRDRNRSFNIGYETNLNQNWKSTTRLYYGDYLYDLNENYDDGGSTSTTNAAWYGFDTKTMYLGLERHQLLIGAEYHVDIRQDNKSSYLDWDLQPVWFTSRNNGDVISVYGDDTITVTSLWSASVAGRYDRRRYDSLDHTQHYFNPSAALFYNPNAELTLKLSYGQASRFNSISVADTESLLSDEISEPQRIRTTEFVFEHRKSGQRTLATLYRYRIDRLPDYLDIDYHDIKGAEFESQWLWSGGTTLRGSYAWQIAKDNLGEELPNIPRSIAKLQLSAPLRSERLRASLAVRYIGSRKNLNLDRVGAHTITDLTFTSEDIYPDISLTLAFRNLFDKRYGDVAYVSDDSGLLEQDGRTLWLSLLYSPQ